MIVPLASQAGHAAGWLALSACLLTAASTVQAEPLVELRQGDRIAYIGNTLADRMQHDGWLETLIQVRFYNRQLSFRNLGYAADELNERPRNQNFGDPDKHLSHVKADVIFAFFGYNESRNGEAGLAQFRQQLAAQIDHLRSQKYNGRSAPRLVFFSPIAHENVERHYLPDGAESNALLELYTRAMAEVCAEKETPFVDLFTTTRGAFERAGQPLTLNGIHLTTEGNRVLAGIIDRALFGDPRQVPESELERLRQVVLDKNLHWFNRYRVTDGYNVYGGRSGTGNYDGQTNFTISARELEILDVKAANRDKRIWAVAHGNDLEIDDSNAPPRITLKTNRPGPNPDGSHKFLSGEEAIGQMTVHSGMSVNLFASEEQFPELINPVQISTDPDGRLWVAAWPTYPHWDPANEIFTDKLLILPDDDGDGRADRCIVFADNLHNPTGFEFWGGGVLVAEAPDLVFYKDTNGDDRADVKIRMLNGIDSADTHHTANSFVFGTDGALYYQSGIFQVFGMESPWGKPFRHKGTGVYRFDPLTYESGFHFQIGPNPHGDVVDHWGNQFVSDGTSGTGNHIGFPGRGAPKQLYVKQYRPVPGTGLLQGSHFPEELRGNFLIANAIGFQGVAQYQFANDGATFHVEPVEPILSSKDPNFRPSSLRIGGDGALYISDWQNPLIGHLQHNLRDPNRDHKHGRVYRVTYDGRPLRKPVKLTGMSTAEVVGQLNSPEDDLRYRARRELSGREAEEATSAAGKLAASLDPRNPAQGQTLAETLWVHQMFKKVNESLLRRVLASAEPNARAAGLRTVREWHAGIENVGLLLVELADDPDPKVRAEAVIAAVYYGGTEAAEVIFAAEAHPKDLQLDFVLKEARKSIDVQGYLRDALAAGKPLSKAAQLFSLREADIPQLMKLPPNEAVFLAILARPQAKKEHLRYAIEGLAEARRESELKLLVELVAEQDAAGRTDALLGAGELLLARPSEELRGIRDHLRRFATQGQTAAVRRLAYAAWVVADGNGEEPFAAALEQEGATLADALAAIPLIADPALRTALYPQVRGVMLDPPGGIPTGMPGHSAQPGLRYEYYQPNGPNVALETLDRMTPKFEGISPYVTYDLPEIKVRDAFAMRFSGSLLVPRSGKYTFFLTSDDGSRLFLNGQEVINHDGLHGASTKSAQLELSAGVQAIIVTYFDNGGGDALSLEWQGPGMNKQRIAPESFSTGGEATVQDAAVAAVGAIPGLETQKFHDLARLVRAGQSRAAAIHVLRGLPTSAAPKAEVRSLVDSLIAHLSLVPTRNRTGPEATEAVELTKALAALLPADQARGILERLENLDVRVIALSTVPERMIYDKERIVVEAGKPVELRFSNTDAMPHNLVLTIPGALEEIGLLAEATATADDVMERQYVPKSEKLLLSSRLLQPGEFQAISFDAPKEPGVYPYVCTYPGHWRRMHGMLVVVEDLAEYQIAPEKYLSAHKIEVQDELLKLIGSSREWEYDELAELLPALRVGRSFEVGRSAFRVSSCVACHKLGGEGEEIGPDLAKLEGEKGTAEHLLRSLLLPSDKVEEKYRSHTFVLDSGRVVTGMILEETAEEVVVVDNPLAKSKPLRLKVGEIDERIPSDNSIMPAGLLGKLTREEILDLLAYLLAGGNAKHPLYQGTGGHEHHHH